MPLKIEGKNPIFANLWTPSRQFEPHHSIMRGKSGNLKQYSQSVVRLQHAYQTWWVSHHPHLKSVVLLGHGVRQINIQTDITSAV